MERRLWEGAARVFVPGSFLMKSSETRGYNPRRLVEFGGRAFDTLMALIDARGTVLGKDELMSRVWPDRVVEGNNLPAQIAVLRQVFGADRDLIRTVAGRGYQFTGEIRMTAAAAAAATPSRVTNLPEAVSGLIG